MKVEAVERVNEMKQLIGRKLALLMAVKETGSSLTDSLSRKIDSVA